VSHHPFVAPIGLPLSSISDGGAPILSIVLPCYRECANLEVLLPKIREEFAGVSHEVIVVDDHSRDGTLELVAREAAAHGDVRLIERDGLRGIGSALRDGYDEARGEYILSSDADLSFLTSDMARIFREVQQGYDLVLGYKLSYRPMRRSSRLTEIVTRLSFVLSELGNLTVATMTGVLGIKNFNTNFRVVRRDLWERLETHEDRNFFLLEMILAARRAGARITEIPVQFLDRRFGESKMSYGVEAPRYLFKLVRVVLRGRHRAG
jgi:dolichol-phosphate mannosyltransferase